MAAYTPGGRKNGTIFVRLNLLHCQNQKITITKDPTTAKCVATLPCEMSNVLKSTIENKVKQHIFKKLTTGNNVFIVSVIV